MGLPRMVSLPWVTAGGGAMILGVANLACAVPADASALYARNLLAFLGLLLDKAGEVAPDWDDEILKAALVTRGGIVTMPGFGPGFGPGPGAS